MNYYTKIVAIIKHRSVVSLWVCYVYTWTNFSKQKETWAEFSTLKLAVCKLCTRVIINQNEN